MQGLHGPALAMGTLPSAIVPRPFQSFAPRISSKQAMPSVPHATVSPSMMQGRARASTIGAKRFVRSIAGTAVELHPFAALAHNYRQAVILISCSHSLADSRLYSPFMPTTCICRTKSQCAMLPSPGSDARKLCSPVLLRSKHGSDFKVLREAHTVPPFTLSVPGGS